MSSISVRFNSFLFSYSIFNDHKARFREQWRVKSEERKVSVEKRIAFSSFPFLFSLLSLLSPSFVRLWSVWMDSNHRPRAYQARALTTWATNRSQVSFPYHPPMFPFGWWRWWDSNPWPPACRAGALPAELHPHFHGLLFFQRSFKLSLAWSL